MNSKSHYEAHSAESYESAFFYEEGSYTKHLCDLVVGRLCLKQSTKPRVLLDIGGGTGNFTKMLGKEAPSLDSIVVDPFLPESSQKDDDICFVKASGEEFMSDQVNDSDTRWRRGYHQILMKEVVHHFKESDRMAIFKGMFEGLSQESLSTKDTKAPSLLIITRPQRDIDYPLWDEAREVWAENQPHADDFVKDLKAAGFGEVYYTVEAYPCEIAMGRWQAMVKARFWSTFANFSDSELEAACRTITESEKERTDEDGRIRFEDRLVFISAYK